MTRDFVTATDVSYCEPVPYVREEISPRATLPIAQFVRDFELAKSTRAACFEELRSEIAKELAAYWRYPRGWDGYSGSEFDAQQIVRVNEVADNLVKCFEWFGVVPEEIEPGPASDGSIDLECSVGPRCLLLTFRPGSTDVGVYGRDSEFEQESTEGLKELPLEEWVSWLGGTSVLPPAVEAFGETTR